MVPVWMTLSTGFQGHDYSTSNNLKMVQHTAILTMAPTESCIWSIKQCHFQWPWTTPSPRFQGRAIIWRRISEKRDEIHSSNGILIGTYTRPTNVSNDLEWLSKIFNDTKRQRSSLVLVDVSALLTPRHYKCRRLVELPLATAPFRRLQRVHGTVWH